MADEVFLDCPVCGGTFSEPNSFEAAPEAPTWQPIETAPKDGTKVLVYDPAYGMAAVVWDSYWNWVERGADYATEVWGAGTMNPTHWMPLPPPPHNEKG